MPGSSKPRRRRRRLKRKAAVVAAGILSVASVAGASVLVQNFMQGSFVAAGPPCLEKTAGADAAFDGFGFDGTSTAGTANPATDTIDVTQESITLDGLRGDRVTAQEVFVIENNCAVDLVVSIGNVAVTGAWGGKYVELWLGAIDTPTDYPGVVVTEYDPTPIIIDEGTITTAATGTITIPAGQTRPVGVVVTTDAAGTSVGAATWTVQAEAA